MNHFIDIITSFYVNLFTVDIFLYFLAGFCFVTVLHLIINMIRG